MLVPRAARNGTVYYFRQPKEIWSVPVGGNSPRLVLKPVRIYEWTTWGDDVVYLQHSEAATTIEMLHVASGQTRRLATLARMPAPYAGRAEDGWVPPLTSLSVSPDGRWIAYSLLDRVGSDVMLVSSVR